MSTEEMIIRLASQGSLPTVNNLTIWQHADGSGWGVSVDGINHRRGAEAHGETLRGALEILMRMTNHGTDLRT